MFERLSVRIVAAALLWSTALILLSIAFHGRIFGVRSGVEDIPYMHSLIRCTVAGAFYGVFFGALSNIPRHPLWINTVSALFGIVGVILAPVLCQVAFSSNWEPWANGLIAYFAFCITGAILGGFLTPTLKKMVPLGTKLDK